MNATITDSVQYGFPIVAFPFSTPRSFNFVGLAGSISFYSTSNSTVGDDLTSFRLDPSGVCPTKGETWYNYTAFDEAFPGATSQSTFILKTSVLSLVSVPTQFVFPVKVPEVGCAFLLLNGGPWAGGIATLWANIYLLLDQQPAPNPAPYLLGTGGETCCSAPSPGEESAYAQRLGTAVRILAIDGDISTGGFPQQVGSAWISNFSFYVYPSCPPPAIGYSAPGPTSVPMGAVPLLVQNLSGYGNAAAQSAVVADLNPESDGVDVSIGNCLVELFTSGPEGAAVDQETQTVVLVQPLIWNVSFSETGLPLGTDWTVGLGNRTASSTASQVTFSVPPGSYQYAVAALTGYAATPSSGSLDVEGKLIVPISFIVNSPTPLHVTFEETGLPSGTSWSVALNGALHSSTGTSITLSEPNGSYSFSVVFLPGYGPAPSNGTVTVQGSPVSVAVNFVELFPVTFIETGLPLGTNWSVTLTGQPSAVIFVTSLAGGPFTRWSEGGPTVHFDASNGTYSYVTSAPGFPSRTGNVTVGGQPPPTVTIALASTAAPPAAFPILGYAIVGVVALGVVVIATVFLVQRHRGWGPSRPGLPPTPPSSGGPPGPPPAP